LAATATRLPQFWKQSRNRNGHLPESPNNPWQIGPEHYGHNSVNPQLTFAIVSIPVVKQPPHCPVIVAKQETSAKDAHHDQTTPLAGFSDRGKQDQRSKPALAARIKSPTRRLQAHSAASGPKTCGHRSALKWQKPDSALQHDSADLGARPRPNAG
jgi:hypothetical protein